MEWKIGEIFKYNGEWYQCVEGETICSEIHNSTELTIDTVKIKWDEIL